MCVQDLQEFLESRVVSGGAVNVELLRIAEGVQLKQRRRSLQAYTLQFVMDGECCLDRLYGGFYSDWACGGQWNRAIQFLSLLMNTCENGRIKIDVVLDGTNPTQSLPQYRQKQAIVRDRVARIFRHLHTKGTPPPKVWWIPPVGLRTMLRLAFRYLNVTVFCTMDDHQQEVIAYCRENNLNGLFADDAQYAIFDPPRYFSSQYLKLTYKHTIETKEYMIGELLKTLELKEKQLPILGALLGNLILTEKHLRDFHAHIIGEAEKTPELLVTQIAKYISSLSKDWSLDQIGADVFKSETDRRIQIFKESVQYYVNGTANGFLRYRTNTNRRTSNNKTNQNQSPPKESAVEAIANGNGYDSASVESSPKDANDSSPKIPEPDIDTSGFASERSDVDDTIRQEYDRVVNSSRNLNLEATGADTNADSTYSHSEKVLENGSLEVNGKLEEVASASTELGQEPVATTSGATADKDKPVKTNKKKPKEEFKVPYVAPEVINTASERHEKGLMSPVILHLLQNGEVILPCLLEDEQNREVPPVHAFYRPIRQKVYALLFNLHHLQYAAKSNKVDGAGKELPQIKIREWSYSKNNDYARPELVKADGVGWGVPTIQRLWFGCAVEDKRRRLRAFLSCMRSDSPLMLNTAYVPQHLLIMASVLRFIMSSSEFRIFTRQELDAFISLAFSPQLMNADCMQDLTLPKVSSRGVQLATLFMQGVETSLWANDACGAPIPWLMCCPWLFFDGKLLQYKLMRASCVKNLMELCGNDIEAVVKVERMRKAVLEGLNVQFARPMNFMDNISRTNYAPPPLLPNLGRNSGRDMGRRPAVPSRGGQLEVAGVVVSNWGANYGGERTRLRQQPQVTSVGFNTHRKNGGAGAYGRNAPRTYVTHPGKSRNFNRDRIKRPTGASKKKTPNKTANLKKDASSNSIRGPTVETAAGNMTADEFLRSKPLPQTDATPNLELNETTIACVDSKFEEQDEAAACVDGF